MQVIPATLAAVAILAVSAAHADPRDAAVHRAPYEITEASAAMLPTGSESGGFASPSDASVRFGFPQAPRFAAAGPSDGIAFFRTEPIFGLVAVEAVHPIGTDTASTAAPQARDRAGVTTPTDNVIATAVPEPGTVQVFGLGLVILATIAGTRLRAADPSA